MSIPGVPFVVRVRRRYGCRQRQKETPMTQYLLSIYRDDRRLSEAEFQQSYEDVNAVADELTAAGGLVFGGGLDP
jgi:hypothetical protein